MTCPVMGDSVLVSAAMEANLTKTRGSCQWPSERSVWQRGLLEKARRHYSWKAIELPGQSYGLLQLTGRLGMQPKSLPGMQRGKQSLEASCMEAP